MKRIVLCLALAASFATSAIAGENLLTYVPEQSQVLLYAKLSEILELPLLKDMKKDNPDFKESYDELENKLKEKNLKLENLIHSIAVFSMKGDDSGAVFTTGVTEAQLKEVLLKQKDSKDGVQYKEAKMNGKNVIIIETPVEKDDIPANVNLDKQSVITYLKKDLILLTEKDCFGKVLDELKKSNVTKNKKMMAWKKDVTPEALVWAMFDLPKTTKPKQKNPMMAGPENVEGGMLSLSMKGKDKKDIDLDLVLECKDQQTSGMMLMQAKMLIGCLAMSSSQNNPELAMELNKAIVINSEGKNLKAKVSLPKSLQDKLKMFSGGNPTLLPPGVGGQKQPELPVFKPTETKKGE